MVIKRSGSQPSGKGPAEWFTGSVRIDALCVSIKGNKNEFQLVRQV